MRTFIGELIFRFKDDASAKAQQTAKTLGGSVEAIERAANRLNSMPFGGRFTSQLDKLGASASDLDRVRASWERLHSSIASRDLSKAAAKSEIENFKLATLGHFAAINSASQSQMRDVEKRTRAFSNNLQMIMKPALVAMGGYTGAYMIGVGARAGLTAASNEQRERARQHFAGLPEGEQKTIERMSEDLSIKYRTSQAAAMEIMREARLAMPSADSAFGVAEEMIQAYKMMGLMFGPEESITGLRAFNKAMDNINITEDPELYKKMLNAYVKAQQVTGKDMDPEAYAQAIKYARTSGKVFSPEFLQNMLPFLIAESGGSDTGTQLRATFDNFVGGTATKQALGEQGRLGLRDDKGLKNAEDFARDPLKWVNDNIVPALEKDGVDMTSDVAISQAVQKFASNRLAREFIQRAITQRQVYLRLSEMMQGAVGLEGADDVDALDPFSAFKGFKDAFSNLAAAVMPAEQIAAGLNSLADGINALQQSWRDGDAMTKALIGGGAAAGVGGVAYIGKLLFDLATAGPALKGAAMSLEAAAVSLQRSAAAGAVPDGGGLPGDSAKKPRGWLAALLGIGGTVGVVAGSGLIQTRSSREMTPEEQAKVLADGERQWSVIQEQKRLADDAAAVTAARERDYNQWHGVAFEGGRHRAGLGAGPMPGVAEAQQAGQEIQDALNVTAKPTVDKSDLEATMALVNQIKAGITGIGAAASAAHHKAKQAQDAEIRRTFSDYGVAP